MTSETRAMNVQAFYVVPFYTPSNSTVLSSDELKSAPSKAGLKRSESLKTAVSPSKQSSFASLKTLSSKSSTTLGKADNSVASTSIPPTSPTPGFSPPAQQSADTKSDERCSDSSMNTNSETQQKKRRWVPFTKSHKKDRGADVKENDHASAPSPPISTAHISDSSSSSADESHSPQLHEHQCVPRRLKLPSRPNTPKVLKKPPPLNTEAMKHPDIRPQQPHLSDLGKVNAFSSPTPDLVLAPFTWRSTYGPRTPGGTIIPNNLFTPGHLVDREVFLEQLHRQRVTTNDDDDANWKHDLKKRPLSLVPELAEGMGDDDDNDDLGTIAASTVVGVSVSDDIEALAVDLGLVEALDLGALVPHDPNGAEGYIFFTVDADWNSQSGEDATCFFIDPPFEISSSSLVVRRTDEFDQEGCHLVAGTISVHKPKPIDEMTDEELDVCHELVRGIGLTM
ncbi:hypothetical protein Moror_12329 [Moniliophthora roreri MCA 2997]|uniref:Uncharacterized protein n=2 Tax=Moniliophthora roreri TaxID=221103 RepID=V2XSU3_MONRO|nr:hypothetical protein Moror_12329 [Moniliophthora roreri MCA 2997]KAI3615996.1 hypothetical protein WG66_010242 [Moniliophthora roreri]